MSELAGESSRLPGRFGEAERCAAVPRRCGPNATRASAGAGDGSGQPPGRRADRNILCYDMIGFFRGSDRAAASRARPARTELAEQTYLS